MDKEINNYLNKLNNDNNDEKEKVEKKPSLQQLFYNYKPITQNRKNNNKKYSKNKGKSVK